MGLIDGFKAWCAERQFKKFTRNLSHSINSRLESGRQTHEKWEKQFSWYEGIMINRNEFRNKDVMESLKIIRDLNPDASMAIWNFLRLSNNGHELECLKPTGSNDKQGLDYINSLAKRVGALYGGGVDQLINVLNLTGFTQGAICLEVELNEGLNDFVDFHAVDPSTVDFRKDKETGEVQLVQKQSDGTYKVLNREQVFYLPFDPDIGDPYGRSPILPLLQIVFFQVEVLKDLKAVAHNQGHARLDISIAEEAIIKNIPQEIKVKGTQAIAEYANTFVQSIQKQFSQMKADDNFFHPDFIKVDMVGGTAGKSMDATALINIINQQLVSALKQLPILLGRNEGTTETHGTVQWQIYVAGIESIQRGVKRVIERAYNVALQVQGRQSKARLTFNKLRTTDRFQDAQAEQIETNTWIARVQQGWADNNEAANEVVGHDAVAEPQAPVSTSPAIARSRRVQVKRQPKRRADDAEDEYVKEMQGDWVPEVAILTTKAADDFYNLLQNQVETYISRLEEADTPPTRVLMDVHRFMYSNTRKDLSDVPKSFIDWIKSNILTDEGEQLELWDAAGFDWIEQSAKVAGMYNIMEIDTELVFDDTADDFLRSLSDRSRRAVELIQGVTDERVIMALWDVAFEGQYSVVKAANALREDFAFSKGRARTIARTEMVGAARTGQWHSDKQSGMVIGKIWRSAQQDRTRDGHREADGQRKTLDEPFYVQNANEEFEPLMYPGDSSKASADNVINCRCWYKRILEGEEHLLEGGE
ncbi:phage minor head protein [Priestia megaterium]|uniref:phage minor head protein n=1 Tax=Priestia megaterium TaxID=1404 RepID=UPI001CDBFC0A|nr:phage minor head protein [Priestia megaterium]MCA4157660.1 phage head morphogenesis protein [Priestia megaterium]